MLRALSFAIIAAIGISRLVIGPGWDCCRCWSWARPSRQRSAARCAPWPRVRQPWLFGWCSRPACCCRAELTAWPRSPSWPWPVSRRPVPWPAGPGGTGTANWLRSGWSPKPPSKYCLPRV